MTIVPFRRTATTSVFLVALVFILSPQTISSKKWSGDSNEPNNEPNAKSRVPAPQNTRTVQEGNLRVRLDEETGIPASVSGFRYDTKDHNNNTDNTAVDAEAAVAQFLREDGVDILKLDEDFVLVPYATRTTPAGTTMRYQQQYTVDANLTVPVYASTVAVTVNNDHEVTFVASSYKPGVAQALAGVGSSSSETTTLMTHEEAVGAVMRDLEVEHLEEFRTIDADLVVYYDHPAYHLAWLVQATTATTTTTTTTISKRSGDQPGSHSMDFIYDAVTGATIGTKNLLYNESGK